MRHVSWLGLVVLVLVPLVSGCAKEKSTFVRDPVSKVTGAVLIDGKPETMVAVRLMRVGGPDETAGTSKMLTPSAFTDADGKFSIGTYDFGPGADGAPNGEYKITFQWGQINLLGGGRYEGDKFNGKYADPEKSPWSVTVAGQPVDVGTIELTMEGVPPPPKLPSFSTE